MDGKKAQMPNVKTKFEAASTNTLADQELSPLAPVFWRILQMECTSHYVYMV
jgi:hypothetical protein